LEYEKASQSASFIGFLQAQQSEKSLKSAKLASLKPANKESGEARQFHGGLMAMRAA
jgi:hypothetical protein